MRIQLLTSQKVHHKIATLSPTASFCFKRTLSRTNNLSPYSLFSFNQATERRSFHPFSVQRRCNNQSSVDISRHSGPYKGSDVTLSKSQENDNEKKYIKQMQEYFNQYIEEYYEIDEDEREAKEKGVEDPPSNIPESLWQNKRGLRGFFEVDEMIELLQAERAGDIVCIEVPPTVGPHPYIIICSPHNYRHGKALIQTIRKCYKLRFDLEEEEVARTVKNAGGWYCFDMGNIMLHVLSEKARSKYDLETLWGVGSDDRIDEDDDSNFMPTPKLLLS